jgi:hypothetical protein
MRGRYTSLPERAKGFPVHLPGEEAEGPGQSADRDLLAYSPWDSNPETCGSKFRSGVSIP